MGAKAVEAVVNRDPEQYRNTDDLYDAQMIILPDSRCCCCGGPRVPVEVEIEDPRRPREMEPIVKAAPSWDNSPDGEGQTSIEPSLSR